MASIMRKQNYIFRVCYYFGNPFSEAIIFIFLSSKRAATNKQNKDPFANMDLHVFTILDN